MLDITVIGHIIWILLFDSYVCEDISKEGRLLETVIDAFQILSPSSVVPQGRPKLRLFDIYTASTGTWHVKV